MRRLVVALLDSEDVLVVVKELTFKSALLHGDFHAGVPHVFQLLKNLL